MANDQSADNRPAPASFEVNQDLAFQRVEWMVQRLGWLLMAALVILAAAGLTGAGPLATAQVRDPSDTLRVEYSRFERVQASTDLRIELSTNGTSPVELWIANEYLDAVALQSISPNPVETRAEADRQHFFFVPADGAETLPVKLQIRPEGAGMLSATTGTSAGDEITVRQFVYPSAGFAGVAQGRDASGFGSPSSRHLCRPAAGLPAGRQTVTRSDHDL